MFRPLRLWTRNPMHYAWVTVRKKSDSDWLHCTTPGPTAGCLRGHSQSHIGISQRTQPTPQRDVSDTASPTAGCLRGHSGMSQRSTAGCLRGAQLQPQQQQGLCTARFSLAVPQPGQNLWSRHVRTATSIALCSKVAISITLWSKVVILPHRDQKYQFLPHYDQKYQFQSQYDHKQQFLSHDKKLNHFYHNMISNITL